MSDQSLYDRNNYIVFIPDFGNDPLTDRLIGKLRSLPSYLTHYVQKTDEYRPDKIAAKTLGDSELYWVILEYNGLTSFTDICPGDTLNIPDVSSLNNLLLTSNSQVSTNTLYIK